LRILQKLNVKSAIFPSSIFKEKRQKPIEYLPSGLEWKQILTVYPILLVKTSLNMFLYKQSMITQSKNLVDFIKRYGCESTVGDECTPIRSWVNQLLIHPFYC
jgi:hypothetical protein